MNSGIEKEGDFAKEFKLDGEVLQVWGDVRLGRDAVIRARVRGGIQGKGRIVVEEEGVVSGRVEGTDVRVEGKVEGGVTGRGQVWLGKKSVVRSSCIAQGLRIEPGASFRGELRVGEV